MRYWLCFAPGRALGRVALLGALALASGLPCPAPTRAQSPATDDATSPLRFVRGDDVVMFAEFDGLDAHPEAWAKTAAAKILNETPTGAMLEDLAKQILAKAPLGNFTPDEIVAAGKHLMKSGFVVSVSLAPTTDGKRRAVATVILRKVFSNKEVRPTAAKILQLLPAAGTKPTSVVKGGHKMVSGALAKDPYFWWVEESKKEDLIFLNGPAGAEEYIFGCLEGKAPTMLANSTRANLMKARDGFERTGLVFLDFSASGEVASSGGLTQIGNQSNLAKLDLVTGFQGDALMSVTRLTPKDPSKLAAVMGQTFDRGSLPNFPSNSYAFLAFAANIKGLPALIRQDPTQGPGFEKAAAELKEKSKLRLDEDIFGQLGPKVMLSLAPSKAAESGGASGGGLAALARMGMGAGGGDVLPKLAVLIDVVDSKAFGKTLDEFIGFINRDIKADAAKKAEAAGVGGLGGPGGPGRRGGPGAPPMPEFRPLTSGDGKSYMLFIPPEMARSLPKDLRPTIRLGAKQLAIGTSADAAKQVLEGKGNYTPPPELADGFNRLPSQLNGLLSFDTRNFTPETLAALPGKVQQMAAAFGAIQAAQMGAQPPPPLTFSIDSSKLPNADAIRKLLFPTVYTVDRDGDAVRITARAPFPPVPDPALIMGLTLPAIQAARNSAMRQAGGGMPPGFPGQPGIGGPPGAPGQPTFSPPPGSPGMPNGRPGRRGGMDRSGSGGSGSPPQ